MVPDITSELTPEQIDSLIEDMQRKAENEEEGYTDEQFEGIRINNLIDGINDPNYGKFAPIKNNMHIRLQEEENPQWIQAHNITAGQNYFGFYITIYTTDGKKELSFHKIGNVRILESSDYVYIQITPQDHQEDQPKLELFIPKDKWRTDYNPRALSITTRLRRRIKLCEE